MAEKPLVSVVIPTYNGHKMIVQCLETVMNQQTDFPYEVIVVDSSPEPVEPLIKPHFPQVRYVHSEKRLSAGEARNLGAKLANGEFVAFVDDDVSLPPDWLCRIVSHLQAGNELAGVGCALDNANKWSISSWIIHLTEFPRSLPSKRSCYVESFPTAACCYRKSVFLDSEFPQTLSAGGEDPVFNIGLVRQGMKLFLDLTIVAKHKTRSGWLEIVRHSFKLGKGDGFCSFFGETRATLFVRYPVLLLCYPFLRTAYSFWHCLRSRLRYAVLYIIFSPAIFIAYCAWAFGIYQGVKEFQKRQEGVIADVQRL